MPGWKFCLVFWHTFIYHWHMTVKLIDHCIKYGCLKFRHTDTSLAYQSKTMFTCSDIPTYDLITSNWQLKVVTLDAQYKHTHIKKGKKKKEKEKKMRYSISVFFSESSKIANFQTRFSQNALFWHVSVCQNGDKLDWLQTEISNTENLQNWVGKLGSTLMHFYISIHFVSPFYITVTWTLTYYHLGPLDYFNNGTC